MSGLLVVRAGVRLWCWKAQEQRATLVAVRDLLTVGNETESDV
jgi:hypothetical protein